MPDAFHGWGGIAQYNRDLLHALCSSNTIQRILLLSRLRQVDSGAVPAKIVEAASPGSQLLYALKALWQTLVLKPDVILCGHVNLLPVAVWAKRIARAKLVLEIYGVDAWDRHRHSRRSYIPNLDIVISISRYTAHRFLAWSGCAPSQVRILPNAIDLSRYRMKERSRELIQRWNLQDRKVLLTVGRIVSSERYKGHRQIIELLPDLRSVHPNIVYLVVGAGDDLDYLRTLAEAAGVKDRVILTGKVSHEELVEYYNLADAFAMPSTGEGFGFVFLEAAACGVPVLGGSTDGSWDALREGQLGIGVDPDEREQLLQGLLNVLRRPCVQNPSVIVFQAKHFIQHAQLLFSSLRPS